MPFVHYVYTTIYSTLAGVAIALTHAEINLKYYLLFCKVFSVIVSLLLSTVAHCCTVQPLQQSFGNNAVRLRIIISMSSWRDLP
jgi:hypothetical protein